MLNSADLTLSAFAFPRNIYNCNMLAEQNSASLPVFRETAHLQEDAFPEKTFDTGWYKYNYDMIDTKETWPDLRKKHLAIIFKRLAKRQLCLRRNTRHKRWRNN